MVKIQIKKLKKDAKLPIRANEHDAGWNISSTEKYYIYVKRHLFEQTL